MTLIVITIGLIFVCRKLKKYKKGGKDKQSESVVNDHVGNEFVNLISKMKDNQGEKNGVNEQSKDNDDSDLGEMSKIANEIEEEKKVENKIKF